MKATKAIAMFGLMVGMYTAFAARIDAQCGVSLNHNRPFFAAPFPMLGSGKTRAQVLRDVIDIAEFKTREYNPSFVLTQYFG